MFCNTHYRPGFGSGRRLFSLSSIIGKSKCHNHRRFGQSSAITVYRQGCFHATGVKLAFSSGYAGFFVVGLCVCVCVCLRVF